MYGLARAGAFYIPDPLYFFLLLLMYMMPTSYNLQVPNLLAAEHSSECSINTGGSPRAQQLQLLVHHCNL